MKVLIVYHSKTGHTLEAVQAVADGIHSAGSEAVITTAKDFNTSTIGEYDALLLASPCWAGSITGAGIAGPVKNVVALLPDESLAAKRCGGISICAYIGGANTVRAFHAILAEKGCKDYRPGPDARAGVPFSIVKGPAVKEEDKERFRAYGVQFVA